MRGACGFGAERGGVRAKRLARDATDGGPDERRGPARARRGAPCKLERGARTTLRPRLRLKFPVEEALGLASWSVLYCRGTFEER